MHGEYKTPGGKLVMVDLEIADGRVTTAEVTGDFFLEPPEALERIAGALSDMPVTLGEVEIAARVRSNLDSSDELIGFSPESVAQAVRRALA